MLVYAWETSPIGLASDLGPVQSQEQDQVFCGELSNI